MSDRQRALPVRVPRPLKLTPMGSRRTATESCTESASQARQRSKIGLRETPCSRSPKTDTNYLLIVVRHSVRRSFHLPREKDRLIARVRCVKALGRVPDGMVKEIRILRISFLWASKHFGRLFLLGYLEFAGGGRRCCLLLGQRVQSDVVRQMRVRRVIRCISEHRAHRWGNQIMLIHRW